MMPKIVDKGETLTIVKSNFGKVFGGYTAIPWKDSHLYVRDQKAFIFSLTNLYKYNLKSDVYNSIYQYHEGIFWGNTNYDFHLHLPAGRSDCRCEGLGNTFQVPRGQNAKSQQAYEYFAGAA
jgi:hypothetical protein